MKKVNEGTNADTTTPSRGDEIRDAAEAILSEERRAAMEARMRQRKMRLLSFN